MEIFYKEEVDRWVRGDRHIRPLVRKILGRKPHHTSGMQTVVNNFRLGLERKNIPYTYNSPTFFVGKSKKVISFGLGQKGVSGLNKSNPIIAAIGFPYPGDLPNLCRDYNIVKFLQHSEWSLNFVKSAGIYDDKLFDIWSAGIDIDEWKPSANAVKKDIDVLIYNKTYWDTEITDRELVEPIRQYLRTHNLTFTEVTYGKYSKEEYKSKLAQAKVMVFLSAHESQGIAYQECLATGVPVMAWDQGFWLDPYRFQINKPVVPATSVPYFDDRCGVKFSGIDQFKTMFGQFFENARMGKYQPREYVSENLSVEVSTDRMLAIYNSI